jgi:hypothetical protein
MKMLILLLPIAFAACGCGRSDPSRGDSASSTPATAAAASSGIPLDWTHKELLGHLRQSGLNFHSAAAHFGSFWGPAVFLAVSPDREALPQLTEAAADQRHRGDDKNLVYVQLRKSAQDARDAVGVLEPTTAFSNGRFIFRCPSPETLNLVKAKLP